ncbi:MAG: calcium/sodium antiporter [Gemmatimonadota bacterium]|nr:calcium/sodium antiporter [Gemmatimonadota bacterium]MDH3478095.1 calcium/sodium antiporter [Gemmatimonadota bacterium]MDH3570596.1 calcium/sodium antiporter [Gemmatimonadota bacterium]MDH5549423.1 calcium/sodium antiporter [Gemmatimonadota bacterium]
MLIAFGQVAVGLIVLFVGGHYLVQGAVVIALLARVSTAVVALTVVAMGTSMPELAVSIDATARGSTDIAFGNVIGSCIFNVGAILGVTAVIGAIPVKRLTIRFEYPVMLFVSALAIVLAYDGVVDRLDGMLLVVGLAMFIGAIAYLVRRGVPMDEAEALDRDVQRASHIRKGTARAWSRNGLLVVLGIVGLVIGADLAVAGSVTIARTLGITERVVGLTIVAMGTSLPELATCIVAMARREPDIALGNVVGSNIFNLLAILGITATIFPVPVNPRAIAVDNWTMLAFALVLFPMMLRGHTIARLNGVLLLAGFTAFMAYVVMVG